jgi:hypothetical protein
MISCFVLAACSPSVATNDRALRTESEVLDVRVSEAEPNKAFSAEEISGIGFDDKGKESRLFLYFPRLLRLWEEDVIISSIAVVELLINCKDVLVNPENIRLYPLSTPWTPLATWNSPFPTYAGSAWLKPGGDADESWGAITPALRRNPKSLQDFELAFDITQLVKRMILENKPNNGFSIQIVKSDLNALNSMGFFTRNASSDVRRPTSILTFSTKGAVE